MDAGDDGNVSSNGLRRSTPPGAGGVSDDLEGERGCNGSDGKSNRPRKTRNNGHGSSTSALGSLRLVYVMTHGREFYLRFYF